MSCCRNAKFSASSREFDLARSCKKAINNLTTSTMNKPWHDSHDYALDEVCGRHSGYRWKNETYLSLTASRIAWP
jgi:hypothetical protein